MNVLLVPGPAIALQVPDIVEQLARGGAVVELGTPSVLASENSPPWDIIAGPGTMICDAALFDRAPNLRGLVSVGIGCEGFDQREAGARGIDIKTGKTHENVTGMSSATVMLMLALAHDLPGAQEACHAGSRRNIARAAVLDDMVVGLIGYGAIAQDVARRLRAWDISVQAYSPSHTSGRNEIGTRFVSQEVLLATSDLVSLHSSLNATSRHLLNGESLDKCKRGVLIVNTARGGLIDEAALCERLFDGRVAGAALDCFEHEPLPWDSPLRSAPNTILTPHQVGHTALGAASVIDAFIANILSFLPDFSARRQQA